MAGRSLPDSYRHENGRVRADKVPKNTNCVHNSANNKNIPAVSPTRALVHGATPPTVGVTCRETAALSEFGEAETPGDHYLGDGGSRTDEQVVLRGCEVWIS